MMLANERPVIIMSFSFHNKRKKMRRNEKSLKFRMCQNVWKLYIYIDVVISIVNVFYHLNTPVMNTCVVY